MYLPMAISFKSSIDLGEALVAPFVLTEHPSTTHCYISSHTASHHITDA